MQAHMKTLPIEKATVLIFRGIHGVMPMYIMPTSVFQLDEIYSDEEDTVSVEKVFGDLFNECGEPAVLLSGLRHREGLTQHEFAKILNITQANLSAMENGRRSIGKELAKRIATKFQLDYRMFL